MNLSRRNCPSHMPTRLADGLGLEVSYGDSHATHYLRGRIADTPRGFAERNPWFPRVTHQRSSYGE